MVTKYGLTKKLLPIKSHIQTGQILYFPPNIICFQKSDNSLIKKMTYFVTTACIKTKSTTITKSGY